MTKCSTWPQSTWRCAKRRELRGSEDSQTGEEASRALDGPCSRSEKPGVGSSHAFRSTRDLPEQPTKGPSLKIMLKPHHTWCLLSPEGVLLS